MAQGTATGGPAPCPAITSDTARWVTTRSYGVGVELLQRGSYEVMVWEEVEEPRPVRVALWEGGRARHRVYLVRASPDTLLGRWAPARTPKGLLCTVMTRSGAAQAFLQETTRSLGGDKRGPVFTIEVVLPTGRGNTAVLFAGWSPDSAGFKEQLAMAQTLRLLNPGK